MYTSFLSSPLSIPPSPSSWSLRSHAELEKQLESARFETEGLRANQVELSEQLLKKAEAYAETTNAKGPPGEEVERIERERDNLQVGNRHAHVLVDEVNLQCRRRGRSFCV